MEKQYPKEKVIYNKLIRDNYPGIMDAKGAVYEAVIMSEEEFGLALQTKILEEAHELFIADGAGKTKELADLLDVLDAYRAFHLIDEAALLETRTSQRAKKGGFTKRLKLLWSRNT